MQDYDDASIRGYMHEMALAESVLDLIEDCLLREGGKRIKTVRLEIGKLSAVEPEAMRFCFDAVARGTLAKGPCWTSSSRKAAPGVLTATGSTARGTLRSMRSMRRPPLAGAGRHVDARQGTGN